MKYTFQWKLDAYFYSGIDDPDFERDQKKGKKIYKNFIKKYKHTFHTFSTSEEIADFYTDYSHLISVLEKPLYYMYYCSMQNIHDLQISKKYTKIQEEYEQYMSDLSFIQEGWKKIGKTNLQKFFKDPILDGYKNDILSIINHLPHIGLKKSESMKSMNIEKVRIEYQKIQNSNMSQGEKNTQISTLYQKLCSLWNTQIKDGNYGNNPLSLRNRQEQLPDDFVDFFLSQITKYIPKYHEFLKESAYTHREKSVYVLEETIEKYIQTFSQILPHRSKEIEDIFVSNRTDLLPSENKFPGAFSSYRHGELAFLLLHFREDIASVFTLAHEMGHMLHGTLSQKQNAPVYHSPFCLAETASILSEILYFENNLSHNQEARQYFFNSLYTSIFYQLQITLFEKESHKNYNSEKYDYSYLWNNLSQKIQGQSRKNDASWNQVAHIFHSPFYCYSYIFGAISALSLFLRYRDGSIQMKNIEDFYSSGGSVMPLDLLDRYGIDLYDEAIYIQIFGYLDQNT